MRVFFCCLPSGFNAIWEFYRRLTSLPPSVGLFVPDADGVAFDGRSIQDFVYPCDVPHPGEHDVACVPLGPQLDARATYYMSRLFFTRSMAFPLGRSRRARCGGQSRPSE